MGTLSGRRRAAPWWLLGVVCAVGLAATDADRRGDARERAWRAEAEALRELAFQRPVPFRWITADEARALIRDELEATYPSAAFAAAYRDAYVAIGALPPGVDLIEALLALYDEQLLGLYSIRKGTMYALRGGLDPRSVVVHELVHALQHQHFKRTVDLLQQLRRNDDVVSALGAVIEGDASWAMLGVDGAADRRSVARAVRLSEFLQKDLDRPRGAMAAAPRLLRASLVFPYAHGTVLAAHRFRAGGNAALDAELIDGLLSTRQVYFPDDRDPVEQVRLPLDALLRRPAAQGCTRGHDNSAGVLTLDALLSEHLGPADRSALLRAWRGDRFAQLDCGERWELVWLSRWHTPDAAREFARLYRQIAPKLTPRVPLSGVARVRVDDGVVLVSTPALAEAADLLLRDSEVRRYGSLGAWLADGCFPESPCPVPLARDAAAALGAGRPR